jgi:AraC family transcriptional regulator of adaptative response/methylated-DNA-[protein]-cysteine methyltransferase
MTSALQPVEFDADEEARFRAAFAAALSAQAPTAQEPAIALDWVDSPVGPLLLGASDEAIVVLEFASTDQLAAQIERLRKHFDRPLRYVPDHALLRQLRAELGEYFNGSRREFTVPVQYRGSAFQERVWTALRQIPYGQTCSYAAIARTIGDPKSTRAVGAANGLNPIAIVIPCHRVVNANGELGGYGGGRWRKQVLLDLEQGQGRLF